MKYLPSVRTVRVITYASSIFLLLAGAVSAYASTPTVSIESLTPGNTVSVGTNVSFAVATAGFIDPYYSLNDSFVDGSLGSIDLNSAGEFNWTPEQNDVGTHDLTVTAHDDSGDTASVNLTLTVTETSSSVTSSPAYSVSIGIPYPSSTVVAGQTLSFDVNTSGFSSTPTYSVSDSFPDSTVSSADISSSGAFAWTPASSDVGSHVITVNAEDTDGQSADSTIVLQVEGTADTTMVSPVATSDTFTENLALGSSDAQVTALQQLLTAQGDFSGPVTGYYGSLTEAAVEKFQAAHAIQQLGIVGPATRAALNSLETPAASATTSVSPSTTVSTAANPTLTQVQTEIQSLTSQLAQIESQLSALVGQ